MATKDFRASQIETSKIIGTGSISGTTVSIAIYSGSVASNREGGTSDSAMFSNVGSDVFLFVSGTRSNNDFTRTDATLFGGDVVISGTLYAERQVIEVDSVADGDFFVTGNMYVEPDNNSTKSVAFRNAAGTDIFIVDSSNKRVGIGVSDPSAQLEIFGPTSTQLKLSNNAYDYAAFTVGTHGDLTIATVDVAGGNANFVIDADGAVDIDADAGVLSLDGSAGINIGTEAAVAIDIDASTLDIDASGALTIDSATSISIGSTVDKPVVIESTTLDVNSSGAITIDGTSTFSIDGVGVSNITTNGALTLSGSTGLNIASDSGEIDITATKGNIDVNATVGTIDIDSAGALTIDSATSIYIGGTVDKPVNIDATTFALDASTTVAIDGTSISIDATLDSNVTVTGAAKDLDIAVVGGGTQELRLTSAGTGTSAIHLNATAGNVAIDAVGVITIDGDRLLISNPASPGTDTLFSVSGSIGSKGTAVKGTTVFGGDLVVSGNLHGGSPLKINDDIALTGSARFKEQSAPTAGPNEAVLYAKDVGGISKLFTKQSDGLEVGPLGFGGSLNDAYDTPPGGGTKAAGVGAVITVDGQPVQIVRNTPGAIVLAVTGSSLFGETSVEFSNNLPPLPGDDTTFFVSGGIGSQGSATGGTSVFGGDLVVSGNTRLQGTIIVGGAGNGTDSIFFDGAGGNGGPWIRGNASVLTIDGDNRVDIRFAQQVKFAADSGGREVVQIFEPSAATSVEPQLDALQIFSGSIGSRGTTTRGTSVFSGDVVISGTLHGGSPLTVGTPLEIAGGSLEFSLAGENSIIIPDNQSEALVIKEDSNLYAKFATTNSSELITLFKPVEIANAAAGGAPALIIDNDDVDQKAILIEAANTTAHVVDIIANALTDSQALKIEANALTTGGGFIVESSSTDTGAGNLVKIKQSGTRGSNSNNHNGLFIDYDVTTGTAARALKIDSQQTTGKVFELDADAITTGVGMSVHADALTTGPALEVTSNSSNTSSSEVVKIFQEHASASGRVPLNVKNVATNTGANGSPIVKMGQSNGDIIEMRSKSTVINSVTGTTVTNVDDFIPAGAFVVGGVAKVTVAQTNNAFVSKIGIRLGAGAASGTTYDDFFGTYVDGDIEAEGDFQRFAPNQGMSNEDAQVAFSTAAQLKVTYNAAASNTEGRLRITIFYFLCDG